MAGDRWEDHLLPMVVAQLGPNPPMVTNFVWWKPWLAAMTSNHEMLRAAMAYAVAVRTWGLGSPEAVAARANLLAHFRHQLDFGHCWLGRRENEQGSSTYCVMWVPAVLLVLVVAQEAGDEDVRDAAAQWLRNETDLWRLHRWEGGVVLMPEARSKGPSTKRDDMLRLLLREEPKERFENNGQLLPEDRGSWSVWAVKQHLALLRAMWVAALPARMPKLLTPIRETSPEPGVRVLWCTGSPWAAWRKGEVEGPPGLPPTKPGPVSWIQVIGGKLVDWGRTELEGMAAKPLAPVPDDRTPSPPATRPTTPGLVINPNGEHTTIWPTEGHAEAIIRILPAGRWEFVRWA